MKQTYHIAPAYLDLKGLSIYSSLGVGTLRDYISAGDLPAYKVKGKVLVRVDEFDAWVQSHKISRKDKTSTVVDEVFQSLNKCKSVT
ncbi:MAG: hypothetical protein DRH11_07650 [Deltaproteobacteria bacterium]|nr:MAG: hypothetical protein DRH11_07650 [Deltaproteobacteria bacterium]